MPSRPTPLRVVPRGLSVRDLATGRTRTIALARQLGAASDLLDSAVTWLADGTDVAVVASSPAIAIGIGPPPRSFGGSCGPRGGGAAIVFVHVPPAPTPLSARCVRTPRLAPRPTVLGSSRAAPRSLLFATDPRGRTMVERVGPTGGTSRVVVFEDSLPMAIDRSGTRLLFLLGHSPPAFWEATIGRGHLTHRRRLLADSRLGPVAW